MAAGGSQHACGNNVPPPHEVLHTPGSAYTPGCGNAGGKRRPSTGQVSVPFTGVAERQGLKIDPPQGLDCHSMLCYAEVGQQTQAVDRIQGAHRPPSVAILND